jgi:hypothetical protein
MAEAKRMTLGVDGSLGAVDLMRDKSVAFPRLASASTLTALRVWHCAYKSLAPLSALETLRTLVIATYPDASLEPLAGLKQLEYLRVVHMPGVTDLSPLAGLEQLRVLRLETLPSFDAKGNVQEVNSLDPIGSLPALESLELFGVLGQGPQSLRELERSTSLKTVRLSQYPAEEEERYRAEAGVGNDRAPRPDVLDWV